jgi:HK97 family phage major capsid protein
VSYLDSSSTQIQNWRIYVENIVFLRQEKFDLKLTTQALLNKAQQQGRNLNASEQTEYDRNITAMDMWNVKIAAREAEMDRERHAPVAASYRPEGLISSASKGSGDRRLYANMFAHAGEGRRGFSDVNEFFATIHSGLNDRRLYASGQNEGTPAEGGWYVPEEFAAQMLNASLETEIVRPRATVEPMTSSTKKIAGFDDSDHSNGQIYGGFSVDWMAEEGTGVPKTAKARLITLTAKKLLLMTQASNELIADGMTFEQLLFDAFKGAIGWGLDYAFLQGNGAGQPLGVLNDPALIVAPPDGNQMATTITTANILRMYARMHPACINNSIWVVNPTCIPQLMALSLGTSAAVVLILQSGPDGSFTMFGRPVLVSEKMSALGSQGDILFADLSQYTIGMRRELTIDKSAHVGFQQDTTFYRGIMRVDGQGRWNKPLKPKNGDTLSWCVTLAPRTS